MTVAVLVARMECPTPACGYPNDTLADVWRIGRLSLLICQRCARHQALSDWDLAEGRVHSHDEVAAKVKEAVWKATHEVNYGD